MMRGKCPTCGKTFEAASFDAWPSFPFCTDRCKLIDLGRWIDGTNSIPGQEVATPKDEDDGEDE